jgi:hypothetical protein
MAGKLSDLRAGLAKNLGTIPGLRVAQLVPEQVNPPVAVLTRSTVNYHLDMRGGLTEWQMQVQLVAGRMADQQAQRTIDAWLDWDGDYSVRRAIESDQTLDHPPNRRQRVPRRRRQRDRLRLGGERAKFRVIGPRVVAGVEPGGTLELSPDEAHWLIEAGHLERIATKRKSAPAAKAADAGVTDSEIDPSEGGNVQDRSH